MHPLQTPQKSPSAYPEHQSAPTSANAQDAERATLSSQYLSVTSFIERLHRLLLDVVKDEFERLSILDVTSVQALMLYNIGDNELTAGDLRSRGYYQGSNVSYNLKKMVAAGYIHQEKCVVDRRSVRIKLTKEGLEIRQVVCDLWDRHIDSFAKNGPIGLAQFEAMGQSLQSLEHFWGNQIRYIY